MSVLPSIHEPDDPGHIGFRRVAPWAAVILVGLVVFAQQFSLGLFNSTLDEAPAEVKADEEPYDPAIGGLVLSSKELVKVLFQSEREDYELDEDEVDDAVASLEQMAVSRVDRLRVAIVMGEVVGAEAALERLNLLKSEVTEGGGLANEVYWLRQLYTAAQAEVPANIPRDVEDALIDRHGWFGRLAVTFGKPPSNIERWGVVGGADDLDAFFGLLGLWHLLSFLVGVVFAIILFSKARNGDLDIEIVETGVPRTVYVEMFAVFMLFFLVMQMVRILFIGDTSPLAAVVPEVLLWVVSSTCLYPLLRGVSWEEMKIDLGLHRGAGFFKEAGIGVVGYLAGTPLVVLGGMIAGGVEAAFANEEGALPSAYPMFDFPLSGTWEGVVVGEFSAVLWAPVVEETLFRGALHRYLPGWLRVPGRVLSTAAIFGMIHPYSPAGLVEVGLGGIVFGLLREWRGSLVAPMVGHFLHNGTIAVTTVGSLVLLQ